MVVGAAAAIVAATAPKLVAEDRPKVSELIVLPPPQADRNSETAIHPAVYRITQIYAKSRDVSQLVGFA